MFYVISDTFFCDEKMAQKRGFKNAEEMNNHIIKQWNEAVTDDDEIFIFGVAFDKAAKVKDIREILEQLKGKVCLGAFYKNNSLSRKIWQSLGFHEVWDCEFQHTATINGKQEVINFVTKKGDAFKGYSCVDYDTMELPYKDKKICLNAEYWDYAPIPERNLPQMFEDMELYDSLV